MNTKPFASRSTTPCVLRALCASAVNKICSIAVLSFLLPLLVPPDANAQEPVTTVILVRHAEKEAEPSNDPPLTREGRERAAALAEVVRDAGITAVFATQYARTRDTAEPAASALGLTVGTLAVGGDLKAYAAGVAARIRSRHEGETVLVVGHSNTVPAIIEALGAKPVIIQDEDYDHLFIVQIVGGRVRLVRARYGAANPVVNRL